VEVELSGDDRVVADEGPAEVQAAVHAHAGGLQGLGRDLTENHLLGEVLRADPDALPGGATAGDREGGREEQQKRGAPHRRGPQRRSTNPRPKSNPSASSAAGTAPARINR